MKNTRRNFLKLAGLAGLSIAGGGISKGFASGNSNNGGTGLPKLISQYGKSHIQQFNMSGYAAPKIDTVRVGIIGLGQRGPSHIKTMSLIEGVEIKALCDIIPDKAKAAKMLGNSVNIDVIKAITKELIND